mgnify:CR=1 FL=1
MSVEFFEDHCRVSLGKKTCSIPLQSDPEGEDGPDILVLLDEVTHWSAPNEAEEISLEALAKIAEMIERACAKQGLSVEFE